MTKTVASLILFAACGAFGQTFEVASVKPAELPTDGRLRIMMRGGPGDPNDPSRVTWENVSLRDMLRNAYGLRDYQITGPDWLNSVRFNVTATVAPGSTRDQVLIMWQNLLKDRFGVTVHREKRDLPAYALVQAKGGSKMPEAVDDPPNADGSPAGGPSLPPLPPPGGGGARQGFAMRNGMMMMRGSGHLEAKGIQISLFVDMLSRQLDRPVEDQTGLTKKYDIKLDYTPDESTPSMGTKMGMPPPMTMPGGEGGDHAADNNGMSVFTAVQAQLGLKLEAKKLPLDMLIVDHAEKVPTEN